MYDEFPYIHHSDIETGCPLEIGNHSANHYLLASLPENLQLGEIIDGHNSLNSLAIEISDCFSVPFGGTHDINKHTLPLIQKAHYSSALMSRQRLQSGKSERLHGIQLLERFMPRTDDIENEILKVIETH